MNPKLFIFLSFIIFSSCSTYRLKQADKKYNRKEYATAGEIYRELYSKTKSTQRYRKGYCAFRIGECYRRTRYNSRSMNGYRNALRYQYADTLLLLRFAQAQHFNGDYKEASIFYNKHLDIYPYSLPAQNGLAGCLVAEDALNNPSRYHIRKLTETQSNRSDFNPVFTGMNSGELYFLSFRKVDKDEKISPITGQPYARLWHTRLSASGQWERPVLKEQLFPSGAIPDFITYRNGYFYYAAAHEYKNNIQPIIRLIPEQSGNKERKAIITRQHPDIAIEYPAISPDGKYIYFSADLPDGYGGKDIYRAPLFPDEIGAWENLGPSINTPGEEVSPWLRTPNELYFSSDGHPGMGGLDIFKALSDKQGNWEISHLGYPLNSSSDDLYLIFEEDKESGLFCSNRDDLRGYLHIYSFNKLVPDIRIEGNVYTPEGNPVTDAVLRISSSHGLQEKVSIDTLGYYTFTATENTSYILMASAKGYLNQSIQFRTEQTQNDDSYLIDFILTPTLTFIHPGYILYPSNSSNLTPENIETLEQLLCILQEHPYTLLKISSHTDRNGSDDYNLMLSEMRSENVINFFLSRGIPKERIEVSNEGKHNPRQLTAEDCKRYNLAEEECVLSPHYIESLPNESLRTITDQLNRRTEFRIKLIEELL